ncbi:MAG TPA: hypothetical protein VN372_02770 [Methanospirillum sp.]|nr:hypothetical protein [Methanospirillum sp.]
MTDCERLQKCPFYNEYKDKKALANVLGKYIDQYCKGDKKGDCIRMKIAVKFGPEKVPINMTPAGIPVLGTSRDGWSDEAINPKL